VLSLAAIRYRNIFARYGGPIERILTSCSPVFNRPAYQATAYLKPGLIEKKPAWLIYGHADGTGASHQSPVIAEHKAISEALERWAYDAAYRSSEREKYGFDRDWSTIGMAAFPGFKWQARRCAYLEALERWALISWWDRRLKSSIVPSPYPNLTVIRIEHSYQGEVVVMFSKSPGDNICYGHASGENLTSAIDHAANELVRGQLVLDKYRASNPPTTSKMHYFERRLLYFTTREGHAEFLDRVYSPPQKPAVAWRTIFDGEIVGPWSKWTTVWRHCVEMPTLEYLDRDKNFFLW